MPIAILQHSDIGTPGRFGTTLRDHGFQSRVFRPDLPASKTNTPLPPDLDGVQGLLILGGPQNVTDIATLPWMEQEANLIRQAHARELPVLGICLGAQLVSHALGGGVGFRSAPSLGFDTLRLNPTGQTETMMSGIAWNHPQFFSCEQEVQKLPSGGTTLASTKSTPIAAYRVGVRTFGFLFHPECDQAGLQVLAKASGSIAGKAGVNPAFLEKQVQEQYQTYARLSDRLAHNWVTYCFSLERRRAV